MMRARIYACARANMRLYMCRFASVCTYADKDVYKFLTLSETNDEDVTGHLVPWNA